MYQKWAKEEQVNQERHLNGQYTDGKHSNSLDIKQNKNYK